MVVSGLGATGRHQPELHTFHRLATKSELGPDDLRQYGFIDYTPGQVFLSLPESLHQKTISIEEV